MSVGQMSISPMSVGQCLAPKCLLTKCLSAKCLSAKCLSVKIIFDQKAQNPFLVLSLIMSLVCLRLKEGHVEHWFWEKNIFFSSKCKKNVYTKKKHQLLTYRLLEKLFFCIVDVFSGFTLTKLFIKMSMKLSARVQAYLL